MLLSQLEAFVEVARQGSLVRAARLLFVSQPALTARLHRLEAELGEPLFIRGRHGMRLTEIGQAFLPYAERALQTINEGTRLTAELRRGGAGQLAVGAAPVVSAFVLPALLARFSAKCPNVELTVRAGRSEAVLDMVLHDEVQIGLLEAVRHPQIEATPFYEDKLVLVTSPHTPHHPFALRGRIGVDQLNDVRLILFDRTSSYHALTSAFFRKAGVMPRGMMELDNIDSTKKMVQAGLGVALLPRVAVAQELAAGSLHEVEIANAEPLLRQMVAIRRREVGPPSGIVLAFLATLAEIRELFPPGFDRKPKARSRFADRKPPE